jgi:hypothetical protein
MKCLLFASQIVVVVQGYVGAPGCSELRVIYVCNVPSFRGITFQQLPAAVAAVVDLGMPSHHHQQVGMLCTFCGRLLFVPQCYGAQNTSNTVHVKVKYNCLTLAESGCMLPILLVSCASWRRICGIQRKGYAAL